MGKYNKSSDKNIFKDQQPITWTDSVVEKDGKKTAIFIPDTYNGYGDKKSLKHLTEDVVGKHSDNNTAVEAGKKAEEQLEQTDYNQLIKKIRRDKWLSQNRVMEANVVTDPASGETTGIHIAIMTTNESGFSYPRSIHLTPDQMAENTILKNLVREKNDNNNS